MDASTFVGDIPEDLARHAHAGTSFVAEDRGQQERDSYAATLAADFATLAKDATTDEKRAILADEFARYRQGYRQRFVAYLAARSRCLSTMITGGSNFPTARNAKRNASADKRATELLEYRPRALRAIRKRLRPEDQPIMAGDADALPRLDDKLAKAEHVQEVMTAANAAIRKHAKAGPDAQLAALVAIDGISEKTARELLTPDFMGRLGFPSYALTNNAANIRRMRQRAEVVATNQAAPETTAEGTAARLEDAPADNRVRLYFPGKPAVEVRSSLKAAGFRWTPSMGCWQAYRNPRSLDVARAIAGIGG